MPFKFNGDEIVPCQGLVKFNGVNVRELYFNGVHVHAGRWAPSEPLNLVATDDACEIITLTWDDPIEPGSGTYIYDLYENGTRIAQNVTSGHVHTVRYSTPREFIVKTVGSDCPDPKASIPDDGASTWKPNAPTGFNASNILCEEIQFTWSNPAEDGFPNATYNVMQGGAIVAGGADVTSPITLPLLNETLLPYRVEARNKCGFSDSNTENGQAATPPNPISFTASDNLCGKIRINYSPELMTSQFDLWQGTNHIQDNIPNGFEYTETNRSVLPHHLVQTGHCPADKVNSNVNNGQIGWVANAPTGVTATVNNTSLVGKIRITYTASTDNGNPNCVYDLYVNGTLGPQNIPAIYDYSTSYDGNITFTVKARNTCGSSPASNQAIGNAFQKAPAITTSYSANGTCTPGTGHDTADLCMIGGGGSGGAVANDASSSGGGGWSGQINNGTISIANSPIAITIGAGGNTVRANDGNRWVSGNAGGSTSFGSYSTAVGGGGGEGSGAIGTAQYNGNGEGRAVCFNNATFQNGYMVLQANNRGWGGRAGFENGGTGAVYTGGGEGYAQHAGGGAGGGGISAPNNAGATSGRGGGGIIVVTTR